MQRLPLGFHVVKGQGQSAGLCFKYFMNQTRQLTNMAQWLPIENKKSTQFSCHMKGQGQTYELHTHDQKPFFYESY